MKTWDETSDYFRDYLNYEAYRPFARAMIGLIDVLRRQPELAMMQRSVSYTSELPVLVLRPAQADYNIRIAFYTAPDTYSIAIESFREGIPHALYFAKLDNLFSAIQAAVMHDEAQP